MICKSMLGFEVFRAHNNEGAEAREGICFIAAIIRNRFTNFCKARKLKTCRVIEELDNKLYLILNGSGGYDVVNKLTESQIDVLGDAGIQKDDITLVAGEVCYRIRKDGTGISQFHDSPTAIRKRNEDLKAGRNQDGSGTSAPDTSQDKTEILEGENESPEATPQERRKAGRPPGRKNNKTLEREAAAAKDDNAANEPKRRGRPPGRKNNKTLEIEAASQ